jgi:uncharacterized protein YabE (DUF348 family)
MNLQNDRHIAILAIAAVLAVSTVAIGTLQMALADETVTKNVDNTGINVQTHTNQKEQCDTAGASSGIGGGFHRGGTCSAFSADNVTQSGGQLTK